VGILDGRAVGILDGRAVGIAVGILDGPAVGTAVGKDTEIGKVVGIDAGYEFELE
jgi:hypothetical protein